MAARGPACSKCGLVGRSIGFESCCKRCDYSSGQYHSRTCPAVHIRQELLCVMCGLVGAARNYKTCCSPRHRSHGLRHSSRCPTFDLVTRSHTGSVDAAVGSSGAGRNQLPKDGPPPCGGFPCIAEDPSMQLESIRRQTQLPVSEMVWAPQSPQVLQSLVGNQYSSSWIHQPDEKRSLGESRNQSFAPLAGVRTFDPQHPETSDSQLEESLTLESLIAKTLSQNLSGMKSLCEEFSKCTVAVAWSSATPTEAVSLFRSDKFKNIICAQHDEFIKAWENMEAI